MFIMQIYKSYFIKTLQNLEAVKILYIYCMYSIQNPAECIRYGYVVWGS